MQQCTVGSNPTLSATFFSDIAFTMIGEIPKWWRGSPAKGVGLERVARVQIPLSPPDVKCPRCVKIKHLGHFSYVLNWKNFRFRRNFSVFWSIFQANRTRVHTKARKNTAHNQVYHGPYSFIQNQCKCVDFVTFPSQIPRDSVPSFLFLRFSLFLIE